MTKSVDGTWLITGASSGIGRSLAERVVARGGKVLATARVPSKLDELAARSDGRLLPVALDVTRPETIAAAVQAGREAFGEIDILVNNAGHGLFGAVEECDDREIRGVFETNFFGLIAVTREMLPFMRKRRSGLIINISSIGGIAGSAGAAYYCSTKFAVEGLSEALAEEIAEFGLRVMLVEPGPFRTGFGQARREAARHIPDYTLVSTRRAKLANVSGNQPGDPDRAANAIIDATLNAEPPFRLVLGQAAYELAQKTHAQRKHDMEAWKDMALGADFPDAPVTNVWADSPSSPKN